MGWNVFFSGIQRQSPKRVPIHSSPDLFKQSESIPVSYTHLDVYKRQEYTSISLGSSAVPQRVGHVWP